MHFQYEVDNHFLEEQDTDIDFVLNFLNQMVSETSSYCTLSFSVNHYIQCAGSNKKLTVEFRKTMDNGFKHFVVGEKSLFKYETKVPYSGGNIKVKSNEILNSKQAKEIFTSFINDNNIPTSYILRETTEMFLEQ